MRWLLLALVACTGKPEGSGWGPVQRPQPVVEVEVEANPHSPLGHLVQLTSQVPTRFILEQRGYVAPAVEVEAGETVQVAVWGAGFEAHPIDLSWEYEGEPFEMSVDAPARTQPAEWIAPVVELDERPDATGLICLGVAYLNAEPYLCMERDGFPVFAMMEPDGREIDILRQLPDGRFLAIGLADEALLFDSTGALLRRIVGAELETSYDHDAFDRHELIVIKEGPWAGYAAALTGALETRDGEVWRGFGIVVFDPDTSEVIWDWTAHGELGDDQPASAGLPYDQFGVGGEGPLDWTHANALSHFYDGGDSFLVSCRHLEQVIKLDVPTGEVVWRAGFAGDFELVDEDGAPASPEGWWVHQHAPWPLDGNPLHFLLMDNGNARFDATGEVVVDQWSRVVEVELDPTSMTAEVETIVGSADPEHPEFFFGRAQGSVVLADGEVFYIQGLNDTFIAAVDYETREPTFRMSFPLLPSIYRAEVLRGPYDLTPLDAP